MLQGISKLSITEHHSDPPVTQNEDSYGSLFERESLHVNEIIMQEEDEDLSGEPMMEL